MWSRIVARDVEVVEIRHDLPRRHLVVVERGVGLLRPVTLFVDHLLRALDEVRHPADVALRQRDLQAGHALEVVAEQPGQHRAGGADGPEREVRESGRVRRDHGHRRRRPHVHAHHRLGVLGRRHHGVPVAVGIVDRGEPEGLGVLRERDRRRALRRAPLDLASARDRVPQREDDQRDEAAGCRAAPLVDHPVVVGLHAEERELLVLGLPEDLTAEPGERREAERPEDPGAVHVHDTCDRVVRRRPHLRVGHGKRRELFLALPGRYRQPRRGHPLVLVHPRVVGEHPRADVAVLRGEPVDPDVRRLDHVVVDRDQPVELRCVGVHRASLAPCDRDLPVATIRAPRIAW